MKKINKFILIALMSFIGVGTASAQCAASFTSTDNGWGNISFTSTSVSPDTSLYHHWEFGDGAYGSSLTPNHTYISPGTYYVCLTINDTVFGGSCTDIFCDSVVVSGAPAGCNITAGISFTDNGQGNYSFTATSTGNVFNNAWSFGDGSSDAGNTVNHTFAANGTYVISLLSSDSSAFFGCYDYTTVTVVVTGVVNPALCQAGFVIYTDSLFNGVLIANSSTGINLTYNWDFGDGNSSTLQYPNYTYSGNGPYNLCLTVTGSTAIGTCTSTYCDSVGVNGIVLKAGGFTINVEDPSTVGVKEIENVSNLNIFPNPVKNDLNIEFNLVKSSNVEVFITDVLGNNVALVASEKMDAGNNKINYNVSTISKGIYLLNINTDNALQVKKIVVN